MSLNASRQILKIVSFAVKKYSPHKSSAEQPQSKKEIQIFTKGIAKHALSNNVEGSTKFKSIK
jgi:hypothetical protein